MGVRFPWAVFSMRKAVRTRPLCGASETLVQIRTGGAPQRPSSRVHGQPAADVFPASAARRSSHLPVYLCATCFRLDALHCLLCFAHFSLFELPGRGLSPCPGISPLWRDISASRSFSAVDLKGLTFSPPTIAAEGVQLQPS